jgi:tripartite-type tricarboxylate transporter receptor subunit TctC
MRRLTPFVRAILLASCALAAASGASAQEYPTRQIRIVVPYAPGGGADILARDIGQKLGQQYKQAVVIDNRAGAGASIGTEYASRTKPDGYTLLMASPSHAINASLYKSLPFDPIKDFTPVALAGSGPLVLVVNASSPIHTLKEFLATARAKPGWINYASAGVGSSPHLAGELFNMMAKVNIVHVSYKGTAPALTDVLGGQVQAMFAPVPTVIEYLKAGKLRALGVSTLKPFSALPKVPAIADEVPGYEVLQWWGFVVPTGTPAEVVVKLNRDIDAILDQPDMRQKFAVMGAEPGGGSPGQFDTLIRGEVAKWAEVIKTAHVQSE